MRGFFFNKTIVLGYIIMYIVPAQSTLTIYPYITFPSGNVNLQIIHKETKTTISTNVAYTSTGSNATMTLPSLTPITVKANNLDEIVIRVYNLTGAMLYEYMYIWIITTPNILASQKTFITTNNNTKEWLTI
jgi:hypothetical protein